MKAEISRISANCQSLNIKDPGRSSSERHIFYIFQTFVITLLFYEVKDLQYWLNLISVTCLVRQITLFQVENLQTFRWIRILNLFFHNSGRCSVSKTFVHLYASLRCNRSFTCPLFSVMINKVGHGLAYLILQDLAPQLKQMRNISYESSWDLGIKPMLNTSLLSRLQWMCVHLVT